MEDDKLKECLTNSFSKYGKVWIKIRRDPKSMPYAFAQYEVRDS
jgi:hypothetical protein